MKNLVPSAYLVELTARGHGYFNIILSAPYTFLAPDQYSSTPILQHSSYHYVQSQLSLPTNRKRGF